jgi:hypothetical protein
MGRRSSDVEKLPEHVTAYKDRHGKRRYRYRKTGSRPTTSRIILARRSNPSDEYKRVPPVELPPTTLRAPSPVRSTTWSPAGTAARLQFGRRSHAQKNRSIIEDFRSSTDPSESTRSASIMSRRSWSPRRRRTAMVGGPFAAQRLRKLLRRLFELAMKLEMITVNPVELADAPSRAEDEGLPHLDR